MKNPWSLQLEASWLLMEREHPSRVRTRYLIAIGQSWHRLTGVLQPSLGKKFSVRLSFGLSEPLEEGGCK